MQTQERASTGPDVVRFLRHLVRRCAGRVLVIWDGSLIHRSQPVKDFLASGVVARLNLERLPGYAPDLDPDEPRPNQCRCNPAQREEHRAYDGNAFGAPSRWPYPSGRAAL